MTLDEYQTLARQTAIYPESMRVVYPVIGLAGETGEVAEKLKKVIRDQQGAFDDSARELMVKELGDVLWYLAAIAGDLGVSLDEVARINIQKLAARKQTHRLHGSGDLREQD